MVSAYLIHDGLCHHNGRGGNEQQPGVRDTGGFQHHLLAGIAIDHRPAGSLSLLDSPQIEFNHDKAQPETL
jgi:hypothetical protein